MMKSNKGRETDKKTERKHRTTLEILDYANNDNSIVNDFLNEDYEKIKKMIIQGFKDIDTKNQFGHTALHIACLKEDIERIKLLIECGAGLNIKDDRGNTPLFLAIKKANVEIVELFIKCEKIDLNIKNFDGLTPLEYIKEIRDNETPLLWERVEKLNRVLSLIEKNNKTFKY
jgi:ankyrin repeat protein